MARTHTSGYITMDGTVKKLSEIWAAMAAKRFAVIDVYAHKSNASDVYVGNASTLDETTGVALLGVVAKDTAFGLEWDSAAFTTTEIYVKGANGTKILVRAIEN